jgi:hypothetical protein
MIHRSHKEHPPNKPGAPHNLRLDLLPTLIACLSNVHSCNEARNRQVDRRVRDVVPGAYAPPDAKYKITRIWRGRPGLSPSETFGNEALGVGINSLVAGDLCKIEV